MEEVTVPTEQENESIIRQWLGLSAPNPDPKIVIEALRGVHESTMALLWAAALRHWNQRLAEIPQYLEPGPRFRRTTDQGEMTEVAHRTGFVQHLTITPELIETMVRIVARAIEV